MNFLEPDKCVKFVKHIIEHTEVQNAPVNAGIPMCKVCNKTIDEIYEEKKTSLERLEEELKYLQEKFLEWQDRVIKYRQREIEEKDTWNLVEELIVDDEAKITMYFDKEDIKTFIQKVKSDMLREFYSTSKAYIKFEEIIDKRAGDLK